MSNHGFDDGRHDPLVVQAIALAIGHQLTHTAQPCGGAALDLAHCLSAGQGVDDGQTDQAIRVASHRLDDIVILQPAEIHVAPAKAAHDGAIHRRAVHLGHQLVGGAQPGLGIDIQLPEPGIADQALVAPGHDLWRCDVGMKIDDHTDSPGGL